MATKMTREEAIKIVQSATVWTDEERKALAVLIPELAESEDERMLREIKRYIKEQGDKPTGLPNGTVSVSDMIAWLEKQKEQKKEKIPPYVTGFKGHPDPAGTSDLEEAAEKYIQGSMCDLDDGPTVGLAKESFIAGAKCQKEQKSAEWDKEDKEMFEAVDESLYCYESGKAPEAVAQIEAERCWLHFLPERFNLQPKQEWSEEDEKDMAHIIRILDDCYVYGTHDLSKTDHENLVNKLKSLRPSWSPTRSR